MNHSESIIEIQSSSAFTPYAQELEATYHRVADQVVRYFGINKHTGNVGGRFSVELQVALPRNPSPPIQVQFVVIETGEIVNSRVCFASRDRIRCSAPRMQKPLSALVRLLFNQEEVPCEGGDSERTYTWKEGTDISVTLQPSDESDIESQDDDLQGRSFPLLGMAVDLDDLKQMGTTPLYEEEGFTPLITAAAMGNIKLMGEILDEDATEIQENDKNDRSALWWAAFNQRVQAVDYLLDQEADPSNVRFECVSAVQHLLETKDNRQPQIRNDVQTTASISTTKIRCVICEYLFNLPQCECQSSKEHTESLLQLFPELKVDDENAKGPRQGLTWPNSQLWDRPYIEHGHWHRLSSKAEERKQSGWEKAKAALYYERYSQSVSAPQKTGADFSQRLYTEMTLLQKKSDEARGEGKKVEDKKKKAGKLRGKQAQAAERKRKEAEEREKKSHDKLFSDLEEKARHAPSSAALKEIVISALKQRSLDRDLQRKFVASQIARIIKDETKRLLIECSSNSSSPSEEVIDLFMVERDLERYFPELGDLSKEARSIVASMRDQMAKRFLDSDRNSEMPTRPRDWAEFQLYHCSHRLIKENDPTRLDDAAHPSPPFVADRWQRTLLNVVQQGESALVVAPPSAGKTYASFYVMLRIMKQLEAEQKDTTTKRKPPAATDGPRVASPKARYVFVAHDKPLADQMSSYLYDLLQDSSPFGVYTANYRVQVETCNILICTPVIFSILLQSPDCQDWARELGYVIFDEVDCISSSSIKPNADSEEASKGDYARAIALIQCPFLALSATVADPDGLRGWLQEATRRIVRLIPSETADAQTTIRWNDLQYFHFVPSNKEDDINKGGSIVPFHPLSLLAGIDEVTTAPSLRIRFDVEMSSQRTLELFWAMEHVLRTLNVEDKGRRMHSEHQGRLESFKPDRYFEGGITKGKAYAYQKSLKEVLRTWPVEWLHILGTRLTQSSSAKSPMALGITSAIRPKLDDLKAPTLQLLMKLKERGMLPALCFYQGERDNTMEILDHLVTQLEQMEEGKRAKEGIEKQQAVDTEEDDEGQDKGKPDSKAKQKTKRKAERLGKVLENVKEGMMAVDPSCTFFGQRHPLSVKHLDYWLLRYLKRSGDNHSSLLMRALARGIAVYHSGTIKPFRDLVDVLFRASALPIILATNILSRGVNMPCKTVVLLNDNKYLSSVDVRQMVGRAGRRTFDDVGHVVSMAIDPLRLRRLLLNPIRTFRIANLIDINTALRMLILRAQSIPDHMEATCVVLRRLRTHPMGQGPRSAAWTQELTLRFSLRLFEQMKLVDERMQPTGLAGLVSRTADMFPANFALAFIIMSGVFDNRPELLEKHTLLAALCYIIPSLQMSARHTARSLLIPSDIRKAVTVYQRFLEQLLSTTTYDTNPDDDNDEEKLWTNTMSQFLEDLVATLSLQPPVSINHCLVDFLAHGSIQQAAKQNFLNDNSAFHLIDRCRSLLSKIALAVQTCVGNHLPLAVALIDLDVAFTNQFRNI